MREHFSAVAQVAERDCVVTHGTGAMQEFCHAMDARCSVDGNGKEKEIERELSEGEGT